MSVERRGAASSTSGDVASMPLALADRLFGGTEPIPGPSRRWLLRYLGVAALLAAIIVVRRPDAATNPQLWAEDGYVFPAALRCWPVAA